MIGALIPLFKYSGSTAVKPRSTDSGFFNALNSFSNVRGVSLPPLFCSIQPLSRLDDAHPHRWVYHSNTNLFQKHPHRHFQK